MPKTNDQKYLQKKVKLGSMEMTLYSLDGHTWSSRKDELHLIKERQESGRVTLDPKAAKTQQSQRFLPKKPAPKGVDVDIESGFEDEELFDPVEEVAEEIDVDEDADKSLKSAKQKKSAPAKKGKPEKKPAPKPAPAKKKAKPVKKSKK